MRRRLGDHPARFLDVGRRIAQHALELDERKMRRALLARPLLAEPPFTRPTLFHRPILFQHGSLLFTDTLRVALSHNTNAPNLRRAAFPPLESTWETPLAASPPERAREMPPLMAGNDGKPLSDEPDGPRDAGCRRIVPGRHIYSCPFGRKTVRTIAVFRQKSPRNRAVSVKPKTIRAHVRSILRRGPLHRRRALRIGPTQPPSTLALQRPEKSLLSQDWHEPMLFQL